MVLVALPYCKTGRNPEPMTGIASITGLNLTRFDDILRTNLVKYLIKYKFRKMQFRKSENTFRGLARKHKIIWNFISIFRFWLILSLFCGSQVFIERIISFERIVERRLSLRLMSKRLILFFLFLV